MYPSKIIPFVTGEDNANKLIKRYVSANYLEQELIVEEVQKLKQSPKLLEFHFSSQPNRECRSLNLFDGYGTAMKSVISSVGKVTTETVKLPLIKAVDKEYRWEFIIQKTDENAHIVVCKINPAYQRQGLFPNMVKDIRDFCFNELKSKVITGAARPPIDDPKKDWRIRRVNYRKNLQSGKAVKLTKLHTLWLKTPYAVHGAMLGSEDVESFCILNPEYLDQLSHEDLVDFDQHCPKKQEHSFVELVK